MALFIDEFKVFCPDYFIILRCGNCLTKIYCSKECMKQDWELVHMKICREGADQRKVKDGKKGRTQAGEQLQGHMFSDTMSIAKNKHFVKEVVEACSKGDKGNTKRSGEKRSKPGAESEEASQVD